MSRPKPYVQGSPYFLWPSPQPGSLRYDGFDFVAVLMLYDCHLDRVVVLPPSRAIALQLVPEKVASFTLGGHHFVRLTTDSVANPPVRTGFYDLRVRWARPPAAPAHPQAVGAPDPPGHGRPLR